jgi:FkbM family methyltransferase
LVILAKIDIEGAELPILEDLMPLFDQHRILFVHIETDFKSQNSHSIFEKLLSSGYEVCPGQVIEPEEIERINVDSIQEVLEMMQSKADFAINKRKNPNFILKVKDSRLPCFSFPEDADALVKPGEEDFSEFSHSLIVPIEEEKIPVDLEPDVLNEFNLALDSALLANSSTSSPFALYIYSKKQNKPRHSISLKGRYHENRLTQMLHWVCTSDLDGIVVDLGADIGWVSLLAASLKRHVIAVEANPVSSFLFRKSIRLNNGFSKLITAYDGAVVGAEEAKLHQKIPFTITRKPALSHVGTKPPRGTIVQVPSLLVSELVPSIQQVLFLKIDIEKSEIPVLEDALKLFQEGRVLYMHVETYVDSAAAESVFERIFDAGYELCPGVRVRKQDLQSVSSGDSQSLVQVMLHKTSVAKSHGLNPNFIIKLAREDLPCFPFPVNGSLLIDWQSASGN